MSLRDKRYYYTDPKFELEINLHNIRRELIFLLESCTRTKCSHSSKKQDKSSKSDDAAEAITNDSGKTSPSDISTGPNLKSPSPSTLPAPIWDNSSEKVKIDGWLASATRSSESLKPSSVSSRRCLDFLKTPLNSTKKERLAPECGKVNQDYQQNSKPTYNQSYMSNSSRVSPEFGMSLNSKNAVSTPKNIDNDRSKETAVDVFFKWFKPGSNQHTCIANLSTILRNDE